MYSLFLILHSWLRWVAIIGGVGATMAAWTESQRVGADGRADRWGLVLMMALDLQMLIGLVLYFVVSPNTKAILADFGAAMRDPAARFWAVEHIGTMVIAVALAHIGRALARKAATPASKRTRLLVGFGLATVAMIAATPWPGMLNGRPLFRFS